MWPCRCSFGNFLYPLRMCYCKYLKNMFVRKMWQIRVKKWKISWSEGGWWRSRSERWKLMWPATFGEDFYSLPIAYFRSWCTFAPKFLSALPSLYNSRGSKTIATRKVLCHVSERANCRPCFFKFLDAMSSFFWTWWTKLSIRNIF